LCDVIHGRSADDGGVRIPTTRGIHGTIEFSRANTDHIVECLKELWRRGDLVDDDMVLVTSAGYPNSGNRTT